MSDEQIREFLHHQPFRPFDIRTVGGRVYTVDHPDFLMRSRGGGFVTYTTEDDRVVLIDMDKIESLEVVNSPRA